VFRSPKHNDPDEKEVIDHLIVHISQKGPPAATLRRFTLIWGDPINNGPDLLQRMRADHCRSKAIHSTDFAYPTLPFASMPEDFSTHPRRRRSVAAQPGLLGRVFGIYAFAAYWCVKTKEMSGSDIKIIAEKHEQAVI
jgi:hypothetical protein